MNVFVVLRKEEEEIFKRLKDYRKTTNSNQIVRESLWCYAEKIFGDSIHTGINPCSDACIKNKEKKQ